MARQRLAQVLWSLGDIVEAEKEEKAAMKSRDKFLNTCSEFIQITGPDDPTVWSQLIPVWSGRLTTKRGGGVSHPYLSDTVCPI